MDDFYPFIATTGFKKMIRAFFEEKKTSKRKRKLLFHRVKDGSCKPTAWTLWSFAHFPQPGNIYQQRFPSLLKPSLPVTSLPAAPVSGTHSSGGTVAAFGILMKLRDFPPVGACDAARLGRMKMGFTQQIPGIILREIKICQARRPTCRRDASRDLVQQ